MSLFVMPRRHATWSSYVPPALASRDPAFCPHSVFACSVSFLHQTVIICPYCSDRLVFVMDTLRVFFCEEENKIVNIIQMNFRVSIG